MFELDQFCLLKQARGGGGKTDVSHPKAIFTIEAENVQAGKVAALLGIKQADVGIMVDAFFQPLAENAPRRDKIFVGLRSISSSYSAENKHQLTVGDKYSDRVAWLGGITLAPVWTASSTSPRASPLTSQ